MKKLISKASEARKKALANFTKFKVGAAIETAGGKVYSGTNVECASFGALCCAERVALFSAISDGARSFRRIAVVTDTPEPTAPCGFCRQTLFEFAPNIEVVMVNTRGACRVEKLKDLFPRSFTLPDNYRKKKKRR